MTLLSKYGFVMNISSCRTFFDYDNFQFFQEKFNKFEVSKNLSCCLKNIFN
jgi:hypothetical protein